MSQTHDARLSPDVLRYCAYFAVLSPLYIAWNMIPVYLFLSDIRPLTIGALYTIATLVEITMPYLISSRFQQINLNQVMALDNLLSGSAYLLFATGAHWAFGVGLIVLRIARSLGCVYEIYSHGVFPEEQRVKARVLFLALPEVSQGIAFLVIGIALGVIYPHKWAYEMTFMVLGLLSIVATMLPLRWLPTKTGSITLTTLSMGGHWSLLAKPIVIIDLLIYTGGCLVPMVVWTLFAVNTLHGSFLLVALVETCVSIGVVIAARFVSQSRRARDVVIGLLLMGVASLALISQSTPAMMVLAYTVSNIGSTLWDPHHTDMLYASIPEIHARRFFGSYNSIKKLISLASLPIATAILEVNGRINYGISAGFTILALGLYSRLLSGSVKANRDCASQGCK